MRNRITGILLAAGLSTRMGSLKALLRWHDMPLIKYQIESLLNSGLDEIIVVLGYEASTLMRQIDYPQVTTAFNAAYTEGKLTSIQTGIKNVPANSKAVVLLGVDQPRPSSTIKQLIAEHSAKAPLITVPYQGGHRGHPIIIHCNLFDDILSLPQKTGNLRDILDQNKSETLTVPFSSDHVHLDLNIPSDYQSATPLD